MRRIELSKKRKLRGSILAVGLFVVFCFLAATTTARDLLRKEEKIEPAKSFKLSSSLPAAQQRVHRVGLLQLCVTNWGVFGSQMRDSHMKDSEGGCFTPDPYEEVEAPSAEYPAGSNLEYLFQGGLWIGAKADGKEYVSLACDGWFGIYELWPDAAPQGNITERTTRRNSFCYSPDAVSEQDIIAVYTDTSADIPLSGQDRDPWDNRKHFPFYIQIIQRSYSWSYEYAEDFVLIDFTIKNMWKKEQEDRPPEPPKIHDDERGIIKDMYMGLYIDADCQHIDEDPYAEYGPQDDICGFRKVVTSPEPERSCYDTVNIAWIADNDGHGDKDKGETATIFTSKSPIAVTGTRVVRSPKPGLKHSFNWWISNQKGSPFDWGPWKAKSQERWQKINPYGSGNNFPDNVLGTPGGDASKYFIMSNQEFDYDQIYSCIWPTKYPEEGWLPVNQDMCADLADGFDTRYLLSFGPFDELGPGESLMITIGYIAGNNFHVDPRNLRKNRDNPDAFYANLDFTDLETNATWAAKVYDNPEPDFPCGDGIPDFKGPPPSPPPMLSFHTERGKVRISWNGKETEKFRDPFNGRVDFEGYKIYMSRSGLIDDYALLGSYDKKDYKVYKLNKAKQPPEWVWVAASVTWDSLKSWLGEKGVEPLGENPLAWTRENPFVIDPSAIVPWEQAFYIYLSDSLDEEGVSVPYDSIRLERLDYLFFEPHDWNAGFDEIVADPEYRKMVDLESPPDTADRYWDYEYEIEVFPGEPSYFAVTAFDMGSPKSGLSSLESSKLANAVSIYPIDEPEKVRNKNSGVIVYPNPYRIDGNYYPEYERGGGNYDKRLRFVNLPTRCTISIFTLDGDLVRILEHDKQEGDINATYDHWDLVSRNTQAVVSGIYLFTVEDKNTGETQVGKFVIIK
jgi:hypothetical protein